MENEDDDPENIDDKHKQISKRQAVGAYSFGWLFIIIGIAAIFINILAGLLCMIFGGILWCYGALNNIVYNQIAHDKIFNQIVQTLKKN
jgi:uncharacterized membrane protein YbaN (DUF454 family)